MRSRAVVRITVLGFWVLLYVGEAAACSCRPWPEDVGAAVAMGFEEASTVVLASPKALRNEGAARTVQVADWIVARTWKGEVSVGDNLVTTTETACCLCGMSVLPDTNYLLFLYGDGGISACSLSAVAAKVPERIQMLDRFAVEGIPTPKRTECLVQKVTDGDTIQVRCGEGEVETVNLIGIDAPEMQQPYGKIARKALRKFLSKKTVRLERRGQDRNDQALVHVSFRRSKDIHRTMVRMGFAWCDRDMPRAGCREDEAAAKAKGFGLWKDKDPVPPWVWRESTSK